jgi:hypothetical protein
VKDLPSRVTRWSKAGRRVHQRQEAGGEAEIAQCYPRTGSNPTLSARILEIYLILQRLLTSPEDFEPEDADNLLHADDDDEDDLYSEGIAL